MVMKRTLLMILAAAGLILTLVPSILTFVGSIDVQMNKWLMLLGMILWFATASFLIKAKK
jgi:hypothetical protein